MSEQSAEVVTATETVEVTSTEKPEVDWKAKAREWEKRAKANADAATRLQQVEESQKSEAQKLADRAEAAERQATENESALNRYRVALRHGLAETDIEDLNWSGSDDEIEARVKRFVERQTAAQAGTARPRADADQGARTSALPLNGDPIEAALKQRLGIT